MKTNKLYYLLVISFLMNCGLIDAQSPKLQGLISRDTVFNIDTLKVTGNILVDDGITLTINPGVFVEFQGYYKMDIKGNLIASGTLEDTIVFTIKDTTGFSDTSINNGGWAGIRFDNISADNDSSVIKYCKFMYGKKVGDTLPEFAGGAIYLYNYSKISIVNSVFLKNIVYSSGGAIYIGNHSSPTVKNCRFFENRSYLNGGGIYIGEHSNAIISQNLFYKNIAIRAYYSGTHLYYMGGGGAIYSSSGDLDEHCPVIINNKIFNNTASGGGGIYESNYNITIVNNLICNNKGSGIFNGHTIGKGIYANNTICNNEIRGGIQTYSSALNIKNNIVWGNTYEDENNPQGQIVIEYNNAIAEFCDVQYGFIGEGNIDADPLFQNPTAGAGINFDARTADWSIQNNSPCIDAGTIATDNYDILEYDIFGNERIVGNNIDIGAIEYQNAISVYEMKKNSDFDIYPNPTTDYVIIATNNHEGTTMEIFDLTGVLVKKAEHLGQNQRIDLSNLQPGMYIIRVFQNEKESGSKKLLVR